MPLTHPLSATTLAHGEVVARALLGVDALYRGESGSEDGLAVLNMDSRGRLTPESFASYREAAERFSDLSHQAGALPEQDRRVYYHELCLSTVAFLTWRGSHLSFTDQLTGFLHVPARPADEGEMDDLREGIHRRLGEMGYGGDLQARCAAWEARNRVPADEVEEVLEDLLSQAWDRACERLLPIPAERSDGMKVQAVSGVAYNARCDYLNRTIQLNNDPVLTRPALKHLAVHEGYGGHYVQFKLREHHVAEGLAPADNLLSLVNSASSCVFEGIADASMEMMGWLESEDDRVQALLNRHRSGIGTGAAWRLHALGWEPGKVTDWLRRQALTGGEGWVANRMAFLSDPARAVLIWSYWWGEPTVRKAWSRVALDRRPEFLTYLYGRMHSNRSVGMGRFT
ncbi:MAG TPA: hypothetical protein VLA43_12080 [Longimicrobiales bacterium]|nr:hypothetical protein [Longimicrobiales bacterium]